MAHLTVRSAYQDLTDRINLYPQGAPPAESLYRILQLLFSEVEAALVARLPIKPFTAGKAARLWKKPESEARKILEAAGRPRHPRGFRPAKTGRPSISCPRPWPGSSNSP